MANTENSDRLYFLGLKNHCRQGLQPRNLNVLAAWKESYDKPRQPIEKQRYYFSDRGPNSHAVVFPVVMHGYESWAIKKAECQRILMFSSCGTGEDS